MTPPTVGIIGAGQLARMTAQAAITMAIDVRVLAADPSDPACVAATTVVVGDPGDLDGLRRFARGCDVITFDHERVDPRAIAVLEAEGVAVHPASATLDFSDKALQRRRFADHGFPVPAFDVVTADRGIDRFVAVHGWPVVVKTAVGGYDGRGVFMLEHAAEAERVLAGLGDRVVIVEPMLEIVAELAVVVVRRPSGSSVTYPVVRTIQRDGICTETIAPSGLGTEIETQAEELARSIASMTGAVGVLAVEFFLTPDGLLVNELAPRPHNSGHWTIGGAVTSQFENHLRGILDWPLGGTGAVAPVVAMANILGVRGSGDPGSHLAAALAVEGAHIHLYAKATSPGRKLGHVTALGPDEATALATVRAAIAALVGQPRSSTDTTTGREAFR